MYLSWLRDPVSGSFGVAVAAINPMAVIGLLVGWWWLQKRLRVPRASLSLAGVFVLLGGGHILWSMWGVAVAGVEPLVWMGTYIWLVGLCPLSSVVMMISFPFNWLLPLDIVLAFCFGAVFYFFVGKAFERLVLRQYNG